MSKAQKILFVANVVKWFDKVNGNTYHSVRITRVKDGKTVCAPFQYGYGEHYRQSGLEAMINARWIKGYTSADVYGKYEREKNYPILWNVSDGLKRDCVANGRD